MAKLHAANKLNNKIFRGNLPPTSGLSTKNQIIRQEINFNSEIPSLSHYNTNINNYVKNGSVAKKINSTKSLSQNKENNETQSKISYENTGNTYKNKPDLNNNYYIDSLETKKQIKEKEFGISLSGKGNKRNETSEMNNGEAMVIDSNSNLQMVNTNQSNQVNEGSNGNKNNIIKNKTPMPMLNFKSGSKGSDVNMINEGVESFSNRENVANLSNLNLAFASYPIPNKVPLKGKTNHIQTGKTNQNSIHSISEIESSLSENHSRKNTDNIVMATNSGIYYFILYKII